MRDYVIKYNRDQVVYSQFAEDLFDVRFELAKSRIMDTDLEKIEEIVLEAFKARDSDKSG